jgi:hypothetical protein
VSAVSKAPSWGRLMAEVSVCPEKTWEQRKASPLAIE